MPAQHKLPAVSSRSRRERVADALRDAIIQGDFQPGERLTELELADQLGTSRAPVREALRQLELEGLVTSYPYKGTEVLGVSQEEIDHVLVPVRLALERYAFVKASQQLTPGDFAQLDSLVMEMERAATDAALLALADVRFHEAVIDLSRQPHCMQVWKTLKPRITAYFRRDATYYQDPADVAEQHRTLMKALRSGDELAIDSAIVDHIQTHFTEGKR